MPGTLRVVRFGSVVLNVTRYWVSQIADTVEGLSILIVAVGSKASVSPVHLRKTRRVRFPWSMGVVILKVAVVFGLYHPWPCGLPYRLIIFRLYIDS